MAAWFKKFFASSCLFATADICQICNKETRGHGTPCSKTTDYSPRFYTIISERFAAGRRWAKSWDDSAYIAEHQMTRVTLPTSTVANSSWDRMHCFPFTQITQNSIDLRSVQYNLCILLHIYVVDNAEKMKWLKLIDFIPWAGDKILTEPISALSKNTHMRLLLKWNKHSVQVYNWWVGLFDGVYLPLLLRQAHARYNLYNFSRCLHMMSVSTGKI